MVWVWLTSMVEKTFATVYGSQQERVLHVVPGAAATGVGGWVAEEGVVDAGVAGRVDGGQEGVPAQAAPPAALPAALP